MVERIFFRSASHLLLFQNNQVLLSLRANSGWHDGEYSVPAGHIEAGETARQAMVRETKEEIGLVLPVEVLRFCHIDHRWEEGEGRIDFFFTAASWEGELINNEPHKCADLRWFDITALPDNTVPYVRQAIECVREGKVYSEFFK